MFSQISTFVYNKKVNLPYQYYNQISLPVSMQFCSLAQPKSTKVASTLLVKYCAYSYFREWLGGQKGQIHVYVVIECPLISFK